MVASDVSNELLSIRKKVLRAMDVFSFKKLSADRSVGLPYLINPGRTFWSRSHHYLCIGSWCHQIWLSIYFTQNGSVLQKKRLPVLLPPVVLLAVSSTESKWAVQTIGSD